jgi:hypothetical protein
LNGSLVAQESFLMPGSGAGLDGPKPDNPPGDMKMVLQEVVAVHP